MGFNCFVVIQTRISSPIVSDPSESQNKVKMCILNKRHIWAQGEVLKVINPFRSGKGEERAEGRKKNPDGPAHLWSGGIYTCQLFRLLTLSQTKKKLSHLCLISIYYL